MSLLLKTGLLSMVLLLSACGFSPMYGEQSGVEKVLESGVEIAAPNNIIGQKFRHRLEDRLNSQGKVPTNPAYHLEVTLVSSAGGMGVARDGTVSRFNMTMTSSYVLTRTGDKKVLQRGFINHVSSYNNQVNQYYSTFIADRDSTERGIIELAELYRHRLGAFLMRNPA